MINRNIRDLIADDSYAISFQSLVQYRSALLKVLDSQTQDTRTDDEIIRFLDDNSWGLIDGDLEYNRDGSWRWTYTNQLDRYDGDNDWEKMDAKEGKWELPKYGAMYRPLTLQQQQAARIAELEDLLKSGIQS